MECDHKFKPGKDGMLACELCGFKQAPRKAAAAADPGSMSSPPVNAGPGVDTSKGAEVIEKRRKNSERLDVSTRIANAAADVLDFITFWN